MQHNIFSWLVIIGASFFIAPMAWAQAGSGDAFVQLIPLILIFMVFWLFIIRPQMKKQKDHQKKVSAVKKGDQVILTSGIYGKVTRLLDDTKIEVNIAPGVSVKVAKALLADVIDPNADKAKPQNMAGMNKTKK